MSLGLLLVGLAFGQEVPDPGPDEVVDPSDDKHRVIAEWAGGTCTQALGRSGHHLYVKAPLAVEDPIERPADIGALLGRVTTRACGDEGLGYVCEKPAKKGSPIRELERGQRINGLLRLPITRWLTRVTVTLQPQHLTLRYTLYAEGPGPGDEAWEHLCTEAQSLVRAALGDSPG